MQRSLRDWVNAVEIEEDSTNTRTRLLSQLDQEISDLGPSFKVVDVGTGVRGSDHAKVRALLRWTITSMVKRNDGNVYPTRSLLAWSVSVVLSQLGFQVAASDTVVDSSTQFSEYLSRCRSSQTAQVVLVMATDLPTDPMEANIRSWDLRSESELSFDSMKPRIIPIRAIPWIAFRHVSGNCSHDSIVLADVWDYTFDVVTRATVYEHEEPYGNHWNPDGTPANRPAALPLRLVNESDSKVISSLHKAILRVWSPRLYLVLQKPMQHFVTNTIAQEQIDSLHDYVHRDSESKWKAPPAVVADLWHIMTSMVLASLYAIVTKFVLDHDNAAGPNTEIAFHPLTAQHGRFCEWVKTVASFDRGLPDLERQFFGSSFRKSVFEMLTGDWTQASSDEYYFNRETNSTNGPHRPEYLGLQKNGVLVIVEGLLKPTLDSGKYTLFHLRIGQILTLPVKPNGYIAPADRNIKPLTLPSAQLVPHCNSSEAIARRRVTAEEYSKRLRFDPEPDW